MTITTLINFAGKAVDALLDPRLQRFLVRLFQAVRRPAFSYENRVLGYELDIQDVRGHRARLTREQEVRFLTSEAGVVRELVWGDGHQVGYRAHGARAVAKHQEGMTDVVWLGLPSRPAAGERASVRSSRTVVEGLTEKEEFLEVRIERPTKKLALRVFFPKGRPPSDAHIETQSNREPQVQLQIILRGDRPAAVWSTSRAKVHETYRLRWTW